MEDSSNRSDPSSTRKIRPDPTLYKRSVNTTQESRTQFDKAEITFELKVGKQNIFPAQDPRNSREQRDNVGAENIRAQIAHYATEIHTRQHRLHSFHIFIGYPYARFIRADRSGIIFSKEFDITTLAGSRLLAEFFWRYAICDSEATRGFDQTVRILNPDNQQDQADIDLAKRKLPGPPKGDTRAFPVVEFSVLDSETKETSKYLGWRPLNNSHSLLGRGTRAYTVYNKANNTVNVLKDSWRAEDVRAETEIIRQLNDKQIAHVPTLVCGGDVPATATPAITGAQTTRTHIYGSNEDPTSDNETLKRKKWKFGNDEFICRVHHRLVTKEVGRHLDRFTNTKEFLTAIYDAIKGNACIS
jgi:hypothetical protein